MLEVKQSQALYSDANGSLRISFGIVREWKPKDGFLYRYYTTVDGMFDKYLNNSNDSEYYLLKKMRDLYQEQDYGHYGDKVGQSIICFLTDAYY